MNQPNILLVIADQHRHDWLQGNGDLPVRTPHLDRLRRRGVTFARAMTPSPLCAPARACLATGTDYAHVPVASNAADLPTDACTYYRRLRDQGGYHVAGTGKFDLHKATFDWNLDGSRLLGEWGMSEGVDNEGKFDSLWSSRDGSPRGPYVKHLQDRKLDDLHREDFERRRLAPYADVSPSPLPDDSYLDNWIAGNAHELLDARPKGRPWHLVVNFAGPHDPMDVPESLVDAWRDVRFPLPHAPGEFSGDHQEVRRRYAAMIENIDRHLGSFVDRLEEEGALENTLVIYTSDHGEMLGDHGIWGKSIALDPSIRIPMVIAGPGVCRPGRVTEALVSLEDLAATALEAAGLTIPSEMTSRSLLDLLRDDTSRHREWVISGLDRAEREMRATQGHYGDSLWTSLQSWRAITTTDLKLVVSDSLAHPHLFDLATDPHEERDLSSQRPRDVERLLAMLSASDQLAGDPAC